MLGEGTHFAVVAIRAAAEAQQALAFQQAEAGILGPADRVVSEKYEVWSRARVKSADGTTPMLRCGVP